MGYLDLPVTGLPFALVRFSGSGLCWRVVFACQFRRLHTRRRLSEGGHKLLVPRHRVLGLIYCFSGELASGSGRLGAFTAFDSSLKEPINEPPMIKFTLLSLFHKLHVSVENWYIFVKLNRTRIL